MWKRLPRFTAVIRVHLFQSSSHSGRASPMPVATMASGSAASTASTLTAGAICVRWPKTFSPPHRRIASLMICGPPTVISGLIQIW